MTDRLWLLALALLVSACSPAVGTPAPFDPGAAPAATARAEATAAAAMALTATAAPVATAAYAAEASQLDNRERGLALAEREHDLAMRQQRDLADMRLTQAALGPAATQAQAQADAAVSWSRGVDGVSWVVIGAALVCAILLIAAIWNRLQHQRRLQAEREDQEAERSEQERQRTIEAQARALAPREPVPGLVQIYNVALARWDVQPRPGAGVSVSPQLAIAADPGSGYARRHQWQRTVHVFARHLETRARAGQSTSRREMLRAGILSEDDWQLLTDLLAAWDALDKRQGAATRLADGVTAAVVLDRLQRGYWSVPRHLIERDPPSIAAIVDPGGVVEVDPLPARVDQTN